MLRLLTVGKTYKLPEMVSVRSLTERHPTLPASEAAVSVFSKKLAQYVEGSGLTHGEFCERLNALLGSNVSAATLSRWLRGGNAQATSEGTVSNILAASEYLAVWGKATNTQKEASPDEVADFIKDCLDKGALPKQLALAGSVSITTVSDWRLKKIKHIEYPRFQAFRDAVLQMLPEIISINNLSSGGAARAPRSKP